MTADFPATRFYALTSAEMHSLRDLLINKVGQMILITLHTFL